jgi:N-acylneuraminate cytidylyltransferase
MTAPLIVPGLTYGLALGRGGSKGLPGKNVRPLGGHPLIAWSVAAGAVAVSVDRVLCSTDDDAIAAAAAAAGADVPFRRPAELASSTATDLDVFAHVIAWLAEHEGRLPEFFVQLRPTTPFRATAWIDESVARMKADPAITCIRSIAPAPHTPTRCGGPMPICGLPRCSICRAWPNRSTCPGRLCPSVVAHRATRRDPHRYTAGRIDDGGHIEGVVVPPASAVDIDHLIDFQMAELVFDAEMPQPLIAHLAQRSA